MKASDEPVIIEQDFACSVAALWQALTDPAKMRQWYFDNIPDFSPEPRFETEFMVDAGERRFLHQWRVIEAVAPRKLAYRWTYDGYPGSAISLFMLSGDDHRSHLQLSFDIEADFPDDVPEFRRESCVGGWEYFIGESLKRYLG